MGKLSIKISSGNLETYEALLLQLGEAGEVAPIEQVDLSFGEVTQMFPTAFALIAAYVAKHRASGGHPFVSKRFGANPQSAKLERVMDAIGFGATVSDRVAPPVKPGSGVLPLTPLTPDMSASEVALKVIDTVCETAQPTRDAKEMIFVVVSELVENVLEHAGKAPAYLCGQLSAQKRKLELCVVDTGVGIKKSFEEGGDATILKRMKAGESSLYIALEPGTTSKRGGTGLGLFTAMEAARLTRGSFRLTSGTETVMISREGEKARGHAPWHGTVVNFLVNIDKLGSIAEV